MEVALLLTKQIFIMFLYMAFGFVLYRTKKVSKAGSATLATLLTWLVIPMVLVKSFCVEPTKERLVGLGLSTLAATLAQGLSILVSRLFFKNRPIDSVAAAFGNAGFIGIPLVTACLGADSVFYIVYFVAQLNVLQWIYGVAVIKETKMDFHLKTLAHPLVLSVPLGLILFFTGWGAKLPEVITGTMSGIAAVNSPIAMLVMGVYLAQADMKTLWTDKRLYLVSFVRLVLISLLTLLVFWVLNAFVPNFNANILTALLIPAIAPVGANVAVYSQLHNKDYVYASKAVVLCTLLSLVSMPLVVLLAQYVLR